MTFINEGALSDLPQTECPVGAVLVAAYGVETDSLRVYQLKEEKFIHIIKKGSHRTYNFKYLPYEVIQKVNSLKVSSIPNPQHEHVKKRSYANRI
jgi:hypothetical protein